MVNDTHTRRRCRSRSHKAEVRFGDLGRVQQLTGRIVDTLRSVSPPGNRCHFVILDKDESCPAADLSNIDRPNVPVYSTGELLNTPRSPNITSALCDLDLHLGRCDTAAFTEMDFCELLNKPQVGGIILDLK